MAHDVRAQRNGNCKKDLTREQMLLYVALRKMFWLAHGREANDDELADWIEAQDWADKVRYDDVLTPEEIAEFDASKGYN